MGQYQIFILYILAGNYNWEVIFGKDPFFKDALFEKRQIP